MTNEEIAACICSIAELLVRPRPNIAELKQKENILKKLMFRVDPMCLVHRFHDHHLELVLSLQLIERSAKSGRFVVRAPEEFMRVLLDVIRTRKNDPLVVRHAIALIAVLIVKVLNPAAISPLISNSAADDDFRMRILAEIPSVTPSNQPERDALTRWANEVFPVIHMHEVLVDAWLEFVDAQTIISSSFLETLQTTQVSEDTLVILCKKPQLSSRLEPFIAHLLSSQSESQVVLGSRLLGELECERADSLRPMLEAVKRLVLTGLFSVHARLGIVENTLQFFETRKVVMNSQMFELLVAISSFPIGIEKHFVLDSDCGDDDASAGGLRRRFQEIRAEIRQLVRSLPVTDDLNNLQLQLVGQALTMEDWRLGESLLHAFSAQQNRFTQIAGDVTVALMRTVNLSAVHRTVLNSLMVCGTSFFKYMRASDLYFVLAFALQCLARVDTLDESGWFPFRAKQDNSCVVLLQGVGTRERTWNIELLTAQITGLIDQIKERLYYRDPFRQSRSIFVRSIVRLVDSGDPDAGFRLRDFLTRVCEDCEDLADFVTSCNAIHRPLLWELVFPRLDGFLATNAVGVERIIGSFADMIPSEHIIQSLVLASSSPHFNTMRWMEIAPTIVKHHGARSVLVLSKILAGLRVSQLNAAWFEACLPVVPLVDESGIAFHRQWITMICVSSFSSESFRAAARYAVIHACEIVRISNEVSVRRHVLVTVIQWLVKGASTINSADSLTCCELLYATLGSQDFQQMTLMAFPSLETECKLVTQSIEARDLGKLRRVMKKLALGIR